MSSVTRDCPRCDEEVSIDAELCSRCASHMYVTRSGILKLLAFGVVIVAIGFYLRELAPPGSAGATFSMAVALGGLATLIAGVVAWSRRRAAFAGSG